MLHEPHPLLSKNIKLAETDGSMLIPQPSHDNVVVIFLIFSSISIVECLSPVVIVENEFIISNQLQLFLFININFDLFISMELVLPSLVLATELRISFMTAMSIGNKTHKSSKRLNKRN